MSVRNRCLGWVVVLGLGGAVAGCTAGRISDGGDGSFPPMFDPAMMGPDRRPVVLADHAPPPISGGTLILSRDGRTAIAADPDHDVVWRVDLRDPDRDGHGTILSQTALEPGDEPGRLVEDVRGVVHVVLRRGGAVASIDPSYAQRVTRRAVCSEPRGIAYDDQADALYVACTNGDLVTLPAAGGAETRRLHLDRDLRDVVIRRSATESTLVVSRFRSAQLLVVDEAGAISRRIELPDVQNFSADPDVGTESTPSVAWRMIGTDDGGVEIAHQRGSEAGVSIVEPGGYGGGGFCQTALVQAATSRLEREGSFVSTSPAYGSIVLPVDVAILGSDIVVVSAGTSSVVQLPREREGDDGQGLICGEEGLRTDLRGFLGDGVQAVQPIAVATRDALLVVQVRDPSAIVVPGTGEVTLLPSAPVSDSGHQSFHEAASDVSADGVEFGFVGASLACASCHPEGRDDGRTWNFDEIGPRRTQSISGGVLATEPLHWDGDMEHFSNLIDAVFVNRMGGPHPPDLRVSAIGRWIDAQPAPSLGIAHDADSVERGRVLFEDQDVGCTGCHTGRRFTNNRTVDVGTGGAFQVPSLVGVSARAPYLHDGSAPTLRDRFGPIGGGDQHGETSRLTPEQLDDLIAYLETL